MADRRDLPAAASGAAVLGSRSARRQMAAVLAVAADAGAYSVGFTLARGSLNGFTIYYSGDSSGGANRRQHGITRATWAAQPLHPDHAAPDTQRGAAASCAAQPSSNVTSAQDVCAATSAHAPAAASQAPPTAAARRRGCRGGQKHRKRAQARHKHAPTSTEAMGAPERASAPAAAHNVCTASATSTCARPAPHGPTAAGSTSTPLSASAPAFLPRGGKRVRYADDSSQAASRAEQQSMQSVG